ncbi:hypothetical protein [Mucilaginibacter aquaedulcis]|uniref:hypothetical protein n=1 Tax=Mucilaginibacter aquaedulcis TaxID=1187081 RepID=UPI0025B5D8B4|nr:hypothetical protein [Mucilaginibacter aquaedulcis]MDN3551835.1 hypothetical protein [Mucilaginibacter aquaedulcis]
MSVHSVQAIVVDKPAKHTTPLILKTDSSTVAVRYLDSTSLKAYTTLPEFQYKDDLQKDPSWWTRFWAWFWNLFKPIKINKHDPSPFLKILLNVFKYLIIALGIATVFFMVLKLAGINMLNIFRRKPTLAGLPFTELLEDIHDIDFDSETEKAITQHNYRLAVRLLYLKCLKQLSDADLIKWQIDKTNNAYINELTDSEKRQFFKTLTLQFEYIWYGEFPIDAPVFKKISTLFQDFNKSIA